MTHHKLVAMEQPVYGVATENDRIAQDERDLGSQANQEHSERLHWTFCEISRVIRTRPRGEICSVGQCEAKNKSQDYQPSRTSGSTVSSGDSPAGRISNRTVWQRFLGAALRVSACRWALDLISRLSMHLYAPAA